MKKLFSLLVSVTIACSLGGLPLSAHGMHAQICVIPMIAPGTCMDVSEDQCHYEVVACDSSRCNYGSCSGPTPSPSPEITVLPTTFGSGDSSGGSDGGGSAEESQSAPVQPNIIVRSWRWIVQEVIGIFQSVFHRNPTSSELNYWRSRTDKPNIAAVKGAMQWHKERGRSMPVPHVAGARKAK